jgi:GTP cyclohydrolase II
VETKYVDAQFYSRYGAFNIRVYNQPFNKETVVLWSSAISLTEPVLTRVHSECLTGDGFGSLHCDCGQQLSKSLRMISQEGGVLIYLRQEGRGIGLFEKIKSYKLQAQGHDTFEANVLLGHNPDLRFYEMVKIALQDLGVKKIRLLTNNPSKVSEIANLGIDISDIVNVLVKPCKHNRKYINTKRKKFSHFVSSESMKYQYQFFASDALTVYEIGSFLKNKLLDPLLRVSAAIQLDSYGLQCQQRLQEVKDIIAACAVCSNIQPVLHFSFTKSTDYVSDIKDVINKLQQINKIQLNDFDLKKLASIEWLLALKQIDLPISSEHFNLIQERAFQKMLKKHQCLLILDDSKGTGKRQRYDVLKAGIDELLKWGINRIGLAGGFGPDALDTYFALKRFYRINFSIDAETGVKTGQKTDVSKVKLYLTQLLRNDHPKNEGVEQTKNFLVQNRRMEWEAANIGDKSFIIHPNVFHAGKFPSTAWFAEQILKQLKDVSSFCEIGCGAGVIACLAALHHSTLHVMATDLNPAAVENTKKNADLHELEGRISVRQGDVLDAMRSYDKFDLIFWALPFGFLDPGVEINLEEAQVFDPGYRALRKLLLTAKNHLLANGRLLLGFSSDLGHYDLLVSIAQEFNVSVKLIANTILEEDQKVRFELLEISYG